MKINKSLSYRDIFASNIVKGYQLRTNQQVSSATCRTTLDFLTPLYFKGVCWSDWYLGSINKLTNYCQFDISNFMFWLLSCYKFLIFLMFFFHFRFFGLFYLFRRLSLYFLQDIGNCLQERGAEFGVTTKRRRRCGWLDVFLLQYTNMINGYTALCLTKLDILDTLPEIKLGIGYKLNGQLIEYFPSSAADLAAVEVTKTLCGLVWLESVLF